MSPPLLVFFTNKRPKQGTLYPSLLVDVRKKIPPLLVFFTNKLPMQGTLYPSLLVDVRKKIPIPRPCWCSSPTSVQSKERYTGRCLSMCCGGCW